MAPVSMNGKICYLQIPAIDPARSAKFYSDVFGWKIRWHDDKTPAFDDATGYVSGMWVTNRPPGKTPGIIVSIMVDDINATIALIMDNGGKIVQPVGAEAPEITAHFADPAGNEVGLYQER